MRPADPALWSPLWRWALCACLASPFALLPPAYSQPKAASADQNQSSPAAREIETALDKAREAVLQALQDPEARPPELAGLDAGLQRLTVPKEKERIGETLKTLRQQAADVAALKNSASVEEVERGVRSLGSRLALPPAEIETLVANYRKTFLHNTEQAKKDSEKVVSDLKAAVGKLPPHLAGTFSGPLDELQQSLAGGDFAGAKTRLDAIFDNLQRATGDPEAKEQLAEARAAFSAQFTRATQGLAPVDLPHLAGKKWGIDSVVVAGLKPGVTGSAPARWGPVDVPQAFLLAGSKLPGIMEGYAKRELFRMERSQQGGQLAADAFMALRRLGLEEQAEGYLPLMKIEDPEKRERALREFITSADLALEAERARRMPKKPIPPAEAEKVLEGMYGKHPALGVYFLKRAQYQTFLGRSLADGAVPLKTSFDAWELGVSAPAGTEAVLDRQQHEGGRFVGLAFAFPDGSTRFEGSSDGVRKLTKVHDGKGGADTVTLARVKDDKVVEARTEVRDKEGRLVVRESVTGGGEVSISEVFDPITGTAVREIRTNAAGRRTVLDRRSGDALVVDASGKAEWRTGDAKAAWARQTGTVGADGAFKAESILLKDGKLLNIRGAHVTEIVDPKQGSLGFEVRADDLFQAEGTARHKASWDIAKEIVAALGRDDKGFRTSAPIAGMLQDTFGSGVGNLSGMRVNVEKDGRILVIYTDANGGKRVEEARFADTSTYKEQGFGQGLVVTHPTHYSPDGKVESNPARWKEYLSNGDQLSWDPTFGMEKGGVFTADKSFRKVYLSYNKRESKGGYERLKDPELKDKIVTEVPGSSGMGILGAAIIESPGLGHVLKGGGAVGKTLYSGVVGGGQALVAEVSGSTTYETESWASLEKAFSWTSSDTTDLARTLSPEAVSLIDAKVWESREDSVKEYLRKEKGITPKTMPEDEYNRKVHAIVYIDNRQPITNEERMQVLKGNFGAGSYGGRIIAEADRTQNIFGKAALTVAGGGMTFAEGTAESLPLILATAGLGRVAALAPAANAGNAVKFGLSAARVTNTVMATSLTGTWVVGALDNGGQMADALAQGDFKRSVTAGSHAVTDLVFAGAMVKGYRDYLKDRSQNAQLQKLAMDEAKLKAQETVLREKAAAQPPRELAAAARPGEAKAPPAPAAPEASNPVELDLAGKAGEALKSPAEIREMARNLPNNEQTLVAEYQRAYREAYVDSLTQIHNRKFIDHNMKDIMKEPHHQLVGDVDHFKSFNDRFSHQMGDKVLQEVANIWAEEHAKAGEVGARFGGEEFFGAVKGDSQKALEVAQRINERVRAEVHVKAGLKDPVTISIGVAPSVNLPGKSVQESFRASFNEADAGLYQAKRTGRDRVMLKTPDEYVPAEKALGGAPKEQPLVTGESQDAQRILSRMQELVGKGDASLAKSYWEGFSKNHSPEVVAKFQAQAEAVIGSAGASKPLPNKPPPAAGPTGKVTLTGTEGPRELQVTLDKRPSQLEATFLGKTAQGEPVVVKTPFYKGAESGLTPQEARLRLVEEMSMMQQAAKTVAQLKAQGKLPDGFEIAEPMGLGVMDRAMAKQVYGTDMGDVPTLLMKKADGITLQRWLAEKRPLTPEELRVFERGVKALNQDGITHNDLNLGNIMVSRGADGKIKFTLIDFGGAKARARSGNRWSDYVENDQQALAEIRGFFEADGLLRPVQPAQKPAVLKDDPAAAGAVGAPLPNAKQAVVAPAKVKDYLLNMEHPEGGSKARWLKEALGYGPAEAEALTQQLIEGARGQPVVEVTQGPWGTRYVVVVFVEGIGARTGRAGKMKTVWQVDTGQTAPRLITAVPAR